MTTANGTSHASYEPAPLPKSAVQAAAPFTLPAPAPNKQTGAAPGPVHVDNAAMLHRVSRDFRSDTLTIPTDEMFAVMQAASRGDDVYEEDETTRYFEGQIAALLGKESALFVASGTLSNQLAVRTHLTQPPYSILLDARAHINTYESGGASYLSGAHLIPIKPSNGHHLTWDDDIRPALVLDQHEVHSAPTRLVCLENTLNGSIFPQAEILRIAQGLRDLHAEHSQRLDPLTGEREGLTIPRIALHVDGARMWNVAAETGRPLAELCQPFDTVNMCFSKGLGAPVGSILAGPATFIRKARHFRKIYGAGQRQTGPLAAAAKLAVEQHFPKLKGTHDLARYTQRELEKIGVKITTPAETGMVSAQMAV